MRHVGRLVSITALECKYHKIWLAPDHLSAPTDVYAVQCATSAQIKSLTLAHCRLYASYANRADYQHAEQWSSHHTIQFRLCQI